VSQWAVLMSAGNIFDVICGNKVMGKISLFVIDQICHPIKCIYIATYGIIFYFIADY